MVVRRSLREDAPLYNYIGYYKFVKKDDADRFKEKQMLAWNRRGVIVHIWEVLPYKKDQAEGDI